MERHLHHRHPRRAAGYGIVLGLTCLALGLSAGCDLGRKNRSGAPAARLQYDVSYRASTPPPGSQPQDSNSLRPDDAISLVVTFVPLREWPESALDPVESQTRRITVLPTSTPMAAVAGLLRRAKVGLIQDEAQVLGQAVDGGSGTSGRRETLPGVLPPGVRASFRVLERPDADAGAMRKLEVQARRTRGGAQEGKGLSLEISLVATGDWKEAVLPEADGAAGSGRENRASLPATSGMLTTETIVLTPRDWQERDRLAFLLPSPFAVEGVAAFVALIEAQSPPQGKNEAAAFAALLKECQDHLRSAAEESGRHPGPQFDAGRRGLEDALRLVQSPTQGRRALLYLAREAPAPLIEDITLSATDAVVDRLAHAIVNDWESGPASDAETLGWRLQKAAYQLLVEFMSSDQTGPELEAIAIRYTGEVGRHPAVLKEMVTDAASGADLEQRLLLENFIYLEDISPAARTRAFDWLTARGRAPAGYDPLASVKERRSALNRVLQEQP